MNGIIGEIVQRARCFAISPSSLQSSLLAVGEVVQSGLSGSEFGAIKLIGEMKFVTVGIAVTAKIVKRATRIMVTVELAKRATRNGNRRVSCNRCLQRTWHLHNHFGER